VPGGSRRRWRQPAGRRAAHAVSPALLAAEPGAGRVFGTNPLAYFVARAQRAPFTVDQASSSTAIVSVRDAAAQGALLPEGWAVDADGRPTTDPEAALAGALLPFGGYKGANIALLVELLSSMAGGRWSVDAPPWDSGSRSPSLGMFVLAVDHSAVGRGFPARAEEHLERLAGSGVRLPGWSSHRAARCSERLPGVARGRPRRASPPGRPHHHHRQQLGKETRDRARLPRRRRPASLGTAYRLRDSALDVKVLEVQPDPGGRAKSVRIVRPSRTGV
jgi:Malate/L-lactate dehydrogenase/NAD(P)-binding Rossmann-like domain